MKTVSLKQGSPEWHAHRRAHRNASDAPAMMGHGQKTRSELLHEAHTGMEREVSDYVQEKIFDPGHEFEALARPLAQEFLGKELYPVVAVRTLEGIKLSASFDGVDMLETIGFEHKRLNAALRDAMFEGCTGVDLPLMYQIQMEHQCIVGQINDVLFMASEWRGEELVEERHCTYKSNPELAAAIIAGWKQFEADLAVYEPPVVTEKAVAKIVGSLPVVFDMRVEGKLISCNLAKYKPAALAYIEGINTELEDDQSFADAEADAKFCRESADKLNLAIEQALGQMGDVNEALNAVREIAQAFDAKGLSLEKLVQNRKVQKRNEIALTATAALKAHIAELNASIGKPLMPPINADFAGAMKGKRYVETSQNAVDTELARAKIEATGIADRIKANLATLATHADYSALFMDTQTLVLKQPEDLAAMITARISTHEANEAARKAKEALEQAEREAEVIAQQAREAAAAAKPAATLAADPRDALAQVLTSAGPGPQAFAVTRSTFPGTNVVDATIDQIAEGVNNWQEPDTGAMIKLGEINERLKPMSITADGLKSLGFEHVATDRASKLYRESDLAAICDALIRVLVLAKNPQLATA
jgi:predicted phage-related endonuclease